MSGGDWSGTNSNSPPRWPSGRPVERQEEFLGVETEPRVERQTGSFADSRGDQTKAALEEERFDAGRRKRRSRL